MDRKDFDSIIQSLQANPGQQLSDRQILRNSTLAEMSRDPVIRERRIKAATSESANAKRKKTMAGINSGDLNVSRRPEVRQRNKQQALERFADPLNVPRMTYMTIGTCITTGDQLKFLGNREMQAAGFAPSNVHHCIKGRYRQYKGYTWHRELIDEAR